MKIKWFGHACFLFTSAQGVKVLTDPFDEKVGYQLPQVHADIVTSSHNHYDHNNIGMVQGPFTHINQPGSFVQDGISIVGMPTFHDNVKGAKRGPNIVYNFTIDGINICHCGDLGHVLNSEQVEKIGHVDVLLVPVGGFFTINYQEALAVKKLLNPTITIPMHYKTDAIEFPIAGVEKFLSVVEPVRKLNEQEIELSQETIDEFVGVVVFNYE